MTTVRRSARAALRSRVGGGVYFPGDDGYSGASATWNLAAADRPAAALVASTVEDIAVGARWADDNGLGIAVLSTGHGALSGNEDALLVRTSRLDEVRVDAGTRSASVGPGARWAQVTAAAAPHGLAGLAGGSPGVGVTGYTLGGGLGPVGRTFGFAADRVTRLTVLDAHYRARQVDAHDTDLFWALRGGGSIGIVTGLEFELVSLLSFFGGGVYFDASDAEAILLSYAQWVDGHDERTSTSIALLDLPEIPQLPPDLRGRLVVHLRIAHVDPSTDDIEADGRRILAPMLDRGTVINDYTRVMGPNELTDIHRDPIAPQGVAYRGGMLDGLDPPTISALVAAMVGKPAPRPRMIEVRHLGGAYRQQPAQPNCVTGRDALFNLWATAPQDTDRHDEARTIVDETISTISTSKRGQLNFYGPAPRPGEILQLWNNDDAQRLLAANETLDPRNRILNGHPRR